MIRKIFIIIFSLLTVFLFPFKIYATTTSCESLLMFELETQTVLYEKLPDQHMYPASLTKVMTAILAIELGNLDDELVVDESIHTLLPAGSSHIALETGEQLSLKDLLYALMLPSANDAALVISMHYGVTNDHFVQMMNEKAKELGMNDTNFMNPHGFHEENHYSTASDLAKLVIYAMENETFREIVKVPRYEISATNLKEPRLIASTNDLLNSKDLFLYEGAWIQKEYPGSLGVKTGYTPEAGHCLISYTRNNGMGLVVIALNGSANDNYTDIHTLLDYGFANYKLDLLEKSNEYIEDFIINDEESVPLITKDDVYVVTPITSDAITERKITLNDPIFPIKKGDTIGQLDFVSEGVVVATTELIAAESSDIEPEIVNVITEEPKESFDMPLWLDIIIILILLVLALRFYNKSRIKYRKYKRKKRREQLRRQGRL